MDDDAPEPDEPKHVFIDTKATSWDELNELIERIREEATLLWGIDYSQPHFDI